MPKMISLNVGNLRSMRSMGLGPKELAGFKRLTENGAIPLCRLGKKRMAGAVRIVPNGHKLKKLVLPEEVWINAREINRAENRKLDEKGIEGGWIDGEKLAVQSIRMREGRVSLSVDSINWSEILATKELDFEAIAAFRAFKLECALHVLGIDGKQQVLFVGRKGDKLGNPRMGEIGHHAEPESTLKLTFASAGAVDAGSMEEKINPFMVWENSAFERLEGETGLGRREILPLGITVDPTYSRGALAVVGRICTGKSLKDLEKSKAAAGDSWKIEKFEAVPLEIEAMAKYFRENLGEMVPGFVAGLVMFGHELFGDMFLKAADK